MSDLKRRPTIREVSAAVRRLGAPGMLNFFPNDDDSREVIIEELYRMVPSLDALQWLCSTLIRQVGKWPNLPQVRALLGARFRPRDADEVPTPDCELTGFTPGDNERAFFELQAAETAKQIEAWKAEAKLLPAAEREENMLLLEAAKEVAKPIPEEKPPMPVRGLRNRALTPEEREEQNRLLQQKADAMQKPKPAGGSEAYREWQKANEPAVEPVGQKEHA